jgi:hypothetical protein
MPVTKLTNKVIEAAIEGFEAQKKVINAQIAELRAVLTGTAEPTAAKVAPAPKKRKVSPEGLKRMKEAQQRRWAKIRRESKAPAVKTPAKKSKPKHRISAAGRKALSLAMKKRWAAKKAA